MRCCDNLDRLTAQYIGLLSRKPLNRCVNVVLPTPISRLCRTQFTSWLRSYRAAYDSPWGSSFSVIMYEIPGLSRPIHAVIYCWTLVNCADFLHVYGHLIPCPVSAPLSLHAPAYMPSRRDVLHPLDHHQHSPFGRCKLQLSSVFWCFCFWCYCMAMPRIHS